MVPKRDGGLRPILDLRPINRALCKHPFRMILLVQVLAQIRHWGLVASVDLKDAYFHIQIAPHHRRFLRFALEGTALPVPCSSVWAGFGPTHFLKVHGRSSLPPLRASGTRVLNYLDDWLILAQSWDSHIDKLLRHLEFLRLCVDMCKSILAPSQSITERSAAILSSLRHFRLGSLLHMCPLQFWLKSRVPWTVWTSGCCSAVSRGYIEALRP